MTSVAERPLAGWLQRRGPTLFSLLLLGLLALAGWQWRHGAPVTANLLELLPSAASDPLARQAEQRVQDALNRDLVLLIHHPDDVRAQALIEQAAAQLQASNLFEQLRGDVHADLPALRQQLLDGRLALLGRAAREQLIQQPQAFLQARVRALYDPFASGSLVPPDHDWLGLAQRIERSLPHGGNVQVDLTGHLYTERDGQRWSVLVARSRADAFSGDLPQAVAAQVASLRATVTTAGGQLLAASGLLYATQGETQARHEIGLMGSLASVGALLVLLVAFRRGRVLLAFVPAGVGVLAGLTVCVALFGHIHVLTLVLGSSLIGVAIDYPLHLLSKSWTLRPWHAWHALGSTLLGLTLGLATNAIGYLALAFTPFPALTQVAVFSAAGLLGSYLCSVCLLPALLGRAQIRPWPALLGFAEHLLAWREALLRRLATPWLLLLFGLFCLAGALRLHLHDDLRQWIAPSPALLGEARRLGDILGYQPTSQFYLVRATDSQQLLERQHALAARLDGLVKDGALRSYASLDQLVAPRAEQRRLRQALDAVPAAAAPLQALGVTPDALNAELAQLRALPDQDIPDALAGPLGEPWRNLWLGPVDGGVAGLVTLQGQADSARLAAQADGLAGVQLIDRIGELNRLFAATQKSAVLLKAVACALIFALLCWPFGRRGAARVLAVSLLAALASVACLGWLGQPLTLFALFGLLLVTAIGVDYAILMHERVGGAATSLLGTLLCAVTTWLSFGVLALSATPAVKNFGLAVTLGLVFSFLLAPWAADDASPTDTSQGASDVA